MNDRTVVFARNAAEIAPGVRLNDTYSLLELVGEGGLSQVFRGFNIHTGQRVALKFLRTDFTDDPDTRELFRREATILAELHHEAIVRYLGYSFDPALKREYLVMEFVEGVSLKRRLAGGPLSAAQVLALKTRLASGLAAAHRLGVVHRDISPDNVVLPGGEIEAAKIIDFGIARSTMFGEGTVIGDGFAGKFAFISPEQVRGEPVTAASDVYSLGLVLAAAAGAPLDMGSSLAELAPRRATVPDLAALDPTLRPLISRMLQPSPTQRFPDMDSVLAWTPAPAPIPPPPPRPVSRGGLVAAGVGFGIVAASVGGLAYVYLAASPPAQIAGRNLPPVAAELAPKATEAPAPAPRVETPTPTPEPSQAVVAPAEAPAPPPAVAAVPPPPSLEQVVRDYDGGPCWLAHATGGAVEAIAASSQDFERFAAQATRRLGAAPSIARARIEPAQCAALGLMRRFDPARAPTLHLAAHEVGASAPLAGTVGGLAGRALTLLVVRNDGRVLSLKVLAQGEDAAFSLGIEKVDEADVGQSLLVLAIVAASAPPSLAAFGAAQTRPIASVGKLDALTTRLATEADGASAAMGIVTLVKQ